METRIVDRIDSKDEAEIFEGLLQYNLERIEDKHPRDLGIFMEDESQEKIAGLIGHTHGNWMFIKYLWVKESLRGQQIGSNILKTAEAEAQKRGCKYVFLDTFSFQAPIFYKKLGFHEVFALNNYPIVGKRYYLVKNL